VRLLLLGGHQFLGPHLAAAAVARGHEITRFHRSAQPPDLAGDRDPEVMPGLSALRTGEWDAVVDTSGFLPRHVRASCQRLKDRVQRYLFVSTVSVYASHAEPGQTEDSPVSPLDDPADETREGRYGALKAACEEAVRETFRERAVIVRPGLIVGPGDPTDRFTYWPARIDRGGHILAPGDGRDPIQVIDARDLAEWCLRLLEEHATGTFQAVGPERPATMAGLLAACGAREVTWVPSPFLLERGVQPWIDLPAWIPRESEDGGHNQLDNSRALAAGMRCRSLSQTAADTLAWWKEQARPARVGLSPEREAELLAEFRATGRSAGSPGAGAS